MARNRKKILFISIVVFCGFVFSLTYASSSIYRYMEPSSLEALKSLPYLTWVAIEKKDINKTGVTKYNLDLAFKGLNVYAGDRDMTAHLINMSGETVHEWSSNIYQWHHVNMYPNGDLLGIVEDEALVKLDWDSNVEWVRRMRFHHDVDIAENNDIYVIARKDEIAFYRRLLLPILNEYILVLTPDGKVKKSVSFFEIFKDEISPRTSIRIYGWIIRPHIPLEILEQRMLRGFAFAGWFRDPTDIFHLNTVSIINRDIKGLCRKGNLLICVRNFDLVGILDIEKEKLIWHWGSGELRMPHHPTLLGNGNILIFDNGWERKYSRIIEVNPITKKIVWEYKSEPAEHFFSLKRGACQRLPNGNTLVTESDEGRVFEITKDGKIAWEFYNPDVKNGKRRAIYRMMRVGDVKR